RGGDDAGAERAVSAVSRRRRAPTPAGRYHAAHRRRDARSGRARAVSAVARGARPRGVRSRACYGEPTAANRSSIDHSVAATEANWMVSPTSTGTARPALSRAPLSQVPFLLPESASDGKPPPIEN